MDNTKEKLLKSLNPSNLKLNEPLSKHSTVRIGGPAEIWYEPKTTEEFCKAIISARKLGINVTILGRGSNTLISDKGIAGLVIRNASNEIIILEGRIEKAEPLKETCDEIEARWQSDSQKGTFKYEFKDLDYDESNFPRIEVKLDSGVDMPFAINYLIDKGITGLQWYSRIPGNLGGWIYNNVHGGTHFINEVVKSVKALDKNNNIKILSGNELAFEYDKSRFHTSGEIILEATLLLYKGDKEKAKYVAMEWAKRKSIQPPNSLGSVFKNIDNETKDRLGYPTTATGYIVEHVLKLSGFKINDAAISPKHHNFIENTGNASAKDYLEVIKTIVTRAKEEIGIDLKPEIFFLGFTDQELSFLG